MYCYLLIILFGGCSDSKKFSVAGQIDYIGSSEVYLSKQPVHYKYATIQQYPISTDDNGNFQQQIPVDSTQIIELTIDDQSYPIVAKPDQNVELTVYRSQFPDSVQVSGYSGNWGELFADYYDREQDLLNRAEKQLPDFREGDTTSIPELYQKRYKLANRSFTDTPLMPLYYKAVGEYLVKRLEQLKYQRNQTGVSPEDIRQDIITQAKQLNFFSFESLHAQRASIRDFTNAYANTFGVADSLEEEYGQELNQYDIKRLGYQTLDSARTSVLTHIDGRKARAYAKMYLIAERIGEMPLDVATPSYKEFLDEYSDYPVYTSFLKTFYEEIKRVSPGQPAIPFSLPNKDEEIVKMSDFKGKYVLLDFWASWCIPCLDEFPHMKELYEKYSRDDFEIVAISIEEDSLRWRQTIQRFDNPWPQLYGGNSFQQKTFKAYRGGGIPFYILVDPNGNILRYNDVRPSFNLPKLLDSLITKP
ncbi:MAG: TlpA disulfide reductase family protein [Fodinibius sp.]|nr:TlpA disulfide reductase family protein [Fodinibius sp.]